jgi:hypothetical protein
MISYGIETEATLHRLANRMSVPNQGVLGGARFLEDKAFAKSSSLLEEMVHRLPLAWAVSRDS